MPFLLRVRASLFSLALVAPSQQPVGGANPSGLPEPVPVADAGASSAAEMKSYEELVPGTSVSFAMVPIPGGTFRMGSPAEERDRGKDEGPLHEVTVSPFWMGRNEVTWNEYHVFMLQLDKKARAEAGTPALERDRWADAVSRPTPAYVPMDFEMGVDGCPAISMTQFAARHYTKWLSMKTGRVYRLPTEAEWEYACRAGTTSAYSFGDDPAELPEYAWFVGNSGDSYHPVGLKKPNPWGLFDMHGNVAEWVLDAHDRTFYERSLGAVDPIDWPKELYPRVVRGGSWDDDPEDLRSASRRGSNKSWMIRDPQLPKSIWYHTDAQFVGFRVVRPLHEPTEAERELFWEPDLEATRNVLQRQREGGR